MRDLCVCVCCSRPKQEERGRNRHEVICMDTWNGLHGDPKDNNEVSITSQLSSFLLGLGPWAENLVGKRQNFGFNAHKPMCILSWMSFNLKNII